MTISYQIRQAIRNDERSMRFFSGVCHVDEEAMKLWVADSEADERAEILEEDFDALCIALDLELRPIEKPDQTAVGRLMSP